MSESKPRWIVYVARIGHAGHGLIFVCVGFLSALAGLEPNGHASDSREAMKTIVEQPFGRGLLVLLIAGLACYVLWRVVSAFGDLAQYGSDTKGLVKRARSFCIGIVYAGVTFAAVQILLGTSTGGGGDRSARDWTEKALATPFGSALVVTVGVAIIIGGLAQAHRGWNRRFEAKLDLGGFSRRGREWLLWVCSFGLAARGLVFCMAGIFLVQAGLSSDPGKARGLTGALNSLHSQPHGRWLFVIAAAGLAAFGTYCCVRARYSTIAD